MRILAAAPRLLHPLDRRLVSRDETGLVDEEAAGPDQDPEAVAPQERDRSGAGAPPWIFEGLRVPERITYGFFDIRLRRL